MADRNPLLDPRPSDVVEALIGNRHHRRAVLWVEENLVCWARGKKTKKMDWLDVWRRWCREHGAVVVKKGIDNDVSSVALRNMENIFRRHGA